MSFLGTILVLFPEISCRFTQTKYCQFFLHSFLALFFIIVIKNWSKTKFRRKGLIWVTCPDQSPSLRKAKARNLEEGVEAEAMKECCLVSCSLLPQPTFLDQPGPPDQERNQPQWIGPSHISHQSRKCTYRIAHSSVWWKCFHGWGSLFLDDSFEPSWQKLTSAIA